jgi:O-antigen/teichoic acid export membrane protein
VIGGRFLLAGFGAAYREADAVLFVLALAHAFHIGLLGSAPLLALGRERYLAVGLALAGGILLACGPRLVPASGAVGAAWATLLALLVSKATHALAYRRSRLALLDRPQGLALGGVLGWLGLLAAAPRPWGDLVLVAGAGVSAVLGLRLLRATSLPADAARPA